MISFGQTASGNNKQKITLNRKTDAKLAVQ